MKRRVDKGERSVRDRDEIVEKDDDKNEKKNERNTVEAWRKFREAFERSSGFSSEDFSSFERFTSLMYRPTDPACLGVVRALFGLCMVIDVVDERGLSNVDLRWGDPDTCRFPLINGLRVFPLPWMIILYATMWLGAFGIMLGYRFKLSCGLFLLPYWYIFLVDKSFWNNHTYLYGVVGLLFWGTDANKYFSLDTLLKKKNREDSVPYWNYFILKFQFFALYFIAGLKKSSWEWLEGYAMTNLSRHWVFEPFKLFLTTEQTDFYIVHWFGFIFDLTVGFFMLFDLTRVPAMFFCTAFHLMNSRLFSIGMFPYVCLSTMPLFCRVDWPRKFFGNSRLSTCTEKSKEADSCPRTINSDFENNDAATGREEINERKTKKKQRTTKKQKLVVAVLMLHVALQFFLPYSHFVTKGYNNWVPGLYGYSWDMMVHAWDTILVVVKVRDNENGKDYFLDPGAWTLNDRWAKHGDMVKQYAHCIKDNLEKLKGRTGRAKVEPWANLSSDLSIYVDVWCSLNGRFQQRLFDPTVDLLKAEWHPFKPISYLMPLLRQFSSYRTELERIQQDVYSWSNYTDVLFVADYPGMRLENYVDAELANVSLTVLEGEVAYREEVDEKEEEEEVAEDEDKTRTEGCKVMTIAKGGSVPVPAGRFHKVVTTSPHPACYMYTFANRTKQQLAARAIKQPVRVKEAFPLLKEIGYKVDGFGRAVGHIVNALLHLSFDVPMIRRIALN